MKLIFVLATLLAVASCATDHSRTDAPPLRDAVTG